MTKRLRKLGLLLVVVLGLTAISGGPVPTTAAAAFCPFPHFPCPAPFYDCCCRKGVICTTNSAECLQWCNLD